MMRFFWTALIAIALSGAAQAAAPEFDSDHFCRDFAQQRAGSIPEMAKAVCMLSEESTKAVVVSAWDHAPPGGRDACLKAAGESYVTLAHCLNLLPQK